MGKKILWLFLFFPYGLYLCVKRDSNSAKTSNAPVDELEATETPSFTSDELEDTEAPNAIEGSGRGILKYFLLVAPVWIFAAVFLTQEQREAVSAFLILSAVVVPYVLMPRHRKKILYILVLLGTVSGIAGVLMWFGITTEDMDSIWAKVIAVAIGLPLYFIVLSFLASRSDDPEVKKLNAERKFSKDELKVLITLGGLLGFFGTGYLLWTNRDSILDGLANAGVIGGFVLIIVGNYFMRTPDKRYKTGYRNNEEPNWKIATPCLVVGVPCLVAGLFYSL